ncbi:2-hydroxychromene-2-carboxylate isomerase [Enterovirga aerilata]|uniref:2-hydroxychromene-2-carboxylate isomerase n=1 Tax=Enterovirga aerilata TaxID=2730920 RepID=A0A849I1G2_9HYPH|nr:2-hydroxychromene-2-carboxylate isomerase [Enterovirga sp. DB1703]NNM71178.1 2-hydroxychromene-2-carboxylate isomerase [Enterovirga sp. DB1703]
MSRPVLEFWYEFASTYSYLSAMRIEREAEAAGIEIAWRPFLLGPIFAAQGWTTSPFNLYPAKGRYMWRDMEREAAALGLPCRKPEPFPQNSLLAARVALLAAGHPWEPTFVKAVYRAEFGEGRDISDPATVREILLHLGLDADRILREAQTDANKARLRAQCDEARERGIFGAPSFITPDGEMFWGNDRLDRALAWAARRGSAG